MSWFYRKKLKIRRKIKKDPTLLSTRSFLATPFQTPHTNSIRETSQISPRSGCRCISNKYSSLVSSLLVSQEPIVGDFGKCWEYCTWSSSHLQQSSVVNHYYGIIIYIKQSPGGPIKTYIKTFYKSFNNYYII